jgi:5-formyltetrahydrofolate cyclo-ligase
MQLLAAVPANAVVATYWPIDDEIDPRFLMLSLERNGYALALPVVAGKDKPLTFRRWGQGDPLESGPYGTHHPSADAPDVIPDVIIAPLLAFDGDCYRLGYGGGFYDRTLSLHPHIKAFGMAYGAQFVDALPHEPHDWPLQGIITETGVVLPRKTVA